MPTYCNRCGVALDQPTSPPTVILTQQGKSSETICMNCHTAETAEILGVDLPPMPFDLINVADSTGKERRFNVFRQVVPKWIIIKAREITSNVSDGYQFAVRGTHKTSIHSLFEKLIKKMEREVNACYITEHTFDGYTQNVIRGDVVKGRLEFDEDSQGEPLVVVDGKSYAWNEFGCLLSQFEGFQFRLKMSDLTDD